MHADICAGGTDDRGVSAQHYDTDALDASNLLLPLVGFLPADDPRLLALAGVVPHHRGREGAGSSMPRRREWGQRPRRGPAENWAMPPLGRDAGVDPEPERGAEVPAERPPEPRRPLAGRES
jgi:hypothetical protein